MKTRQAAKTTTSLEKTAKPAGNVKWQIGKLSVAGGAIFLLLAVLVMVALGHTAKKDPKAHSGPILFLLMVVLGILGAILVLGGLTFLAIGLSGRVETTKLPIRQGTIVKCQFSC